MPWYTNEELITHYQANDVLQIPEIPNSQDQHASYVLALETLIECGATWPSVDAYNQCSNADYEAMVARALARASQHPTANIEALSPNDQNFAPNLGASFFEHSYAAIMEPLPVDQIVTFRFDGTV